MDADPNATAPPNLAVPGPRPADVSSAVHRGKLLLSLRIDHEVLEWFRTRGPRYQTRMNAVLRAYMEHTRTEHDRGDLARD